jgi:GT2 family glycosyltransferase
MDRVDAAVTIVTRNRPDMISRCLDALAAHTPQPRQIIVVDASDDGATRELVAEHDGAQYIHFPNGNNQRHEAKNIGMRASDASVLVFLDDDSVVSENWLIELLKPYDDPQVGCVGGGIIEPGTEWNRCEPVGRILPNGELTQNFSPDHEGNLEVDHVKGCNMSFRRDLLMEIGGFDPGYTGDNVREETDACLAVQRFGRKVVFCPSAVVTHLRAPREGVTREMSDPSQVYFCSRNHAYFILKFFPLDRRKLWFHFVADPWSHVKYLRPNRVLTPRLRLFGATMLGKVTGVGSALASRRVRAMWRRRE